MPSHGDAQASLMAKLEHFARRPVLLRRGRDTMIAMTRVVILAIVLATTACGTGAATFRGSVIAADAEAAGHTFDDVPNPRQGQPVVGARVWLTSTNEQGNCQNVLPENLPPGRDEYRPKTVTDREGRFSVHTTYPGMVGVRTRLLLCIAHPQFEGYEYSRWTDSPESALANKMLNIRLKRR